MIVRTVCQLIIALLIVGGTLHNLRKKSDGVSTLTNVVLSLVVSAAVGAIYWKAGAFSELLP